MPFSSVIIDNKEVANESTHVHFVVHGGISTRNEVNPDLLQWPAMAATLFATWLIASTSRRKRKVGFWCYLVSNVLWVGWGWQASAYALIFLQFALAAMNFRGINKNEGS